MIELPEAYTIARQLNDEIGDKRIESCFPGNSPHKWVFYKPSRKEFADDLSGKTVKKVTAHGRAVFIGLTRRLGLSIDDYGGKVLFHAADARLPEKYHLYISFSDQTSLTVAIQGWGIIRRILQKVKESEEIKNAGPSPTDSDFTYKYLENIFEDFGKRKTDVKTFFIRHKPVAGIGNGYLQDILFKAGIHPKRKMSQLTAKDHRALYNSVKGVLRKAVSQDGRITERDIYGNPGNYKSLMNRFKKGQPCDKCGTEIISFCYLGGTCYVCPACQPIDG